MCVCQGIDTHVRVSRYGKTGALGCAATSHSLVPLPLDPSFFAYAKASRICCVPPLLALAFAAVTHPRLGEGSVYAGLLAELVERIIKVTWPPAWPPGVGPQHVGIARLIGAVID